jgi:hypothetical protein
MTGPDDAFLAPDDALLDPDEEPTGADDVERPAPGVPPREDGVEDVGPADGGVEHG